MPKVPERTNKSKKASEAPEKLRTYIALGVDIGWKHEQEQAQGDCPFCGKSGKFYVSCSNGQFKCFSCTEGTANGGGNVFTFMRVVWEKSTYETKDEDYKKFATDKNLVNPSMLQDWGLCKSYINDMWLLPGYGVPDGKINQLYRYIPDQKGHKRFIPCPGFPSGQGQHLLGYGSFDPEKKDVYICEGFGDGACLRETLRFTRKVKSGKKFSYVVTGDEELSLLKTANVLATPGCHTFLSSWVKCLEDKRVFLLYDNDHHKNHKDNGSYIEPAAWAGMRKAAQVIANSGIRVEELSYLKWAKGDDTIGYDPELPDKYDIRDHLTGVGTSKSKTLNDRTSKVGTLLTKIAPMPAEWLQVSGKTVDGKPSIPIIPCTSWEELILAWKKALEWTEGLDRALSVMLAAVTSTKSVGDQLWVRVMAPPSTAKSTLCEAISTNTTHIVPKSTIRGFFSGHSSDDGEDNSLISKLYNKTLIIKDGDTLLQAPNLGQILSEARDLYDSTGRSSYRTKAGRVYEGVRMTFILCGTSSLHSLDTSELGERFLSCSIMEDIDEDLEEDIAWRVINRATRNVALESNGELKSQRDPEELKAMQLTGGYVDYLRDNAQKLLDKMQETFTDDQKRYVCRLALFTANMRARPSGKQDDSMERELSSRLTSQLGRLTLCLAVVMQKDKVDNEVLERVRQVALDTSKGKTINVCGQLIKVSKTGCEPTALARSVNMQAEKMKNYLRFLRAIKVVECYSPSSGAVSVRYKLTDKMEKLYKLIMEKL